MNKLVISLNIVEFNIFYMGFRGRKSTK